MANASQSSASTSAFKKHDVFINHSGVDVKRKLASLIYQMFDIVGVKAFLDQDELELGDSFPQAIQDAIHSASVHIAIFSPRYAESPWCLDELLLMLQTNVSIIPVFYHVQPSDLRHVENGIYADAFDRHQRKGRHDLEKIKKWKAALGRASYLSGAILEADKCDEGKMVREIVDSSILKMQKEPLNVATFPVGLEAVVQDFESKVGPFSKNDNVHIVGIVGMGGIGKTTLAKELYNRNCSSMKRSSFISKVREAASKNTLHELQKNLLQDLCIKHLPFHNIDQGMGILARDLTSMKVLIVLDDVDSLDQMHALLPLNLGGGSLIIVTTREGEVFTSSENSSIYFMKRLDLSNAKELFCRHACGQPYSENSRKFQYLIDRFVDACQGLPLSLKVFGGMVKERSASYWESQLQKISKLLPKEIVDILKLSYDALDEEVQQMFLDVACFFIGEDKRLVTAIWNGLGWCGEVGLESLVNKCLIELDEQSSIDMHDHLRDLGRIIAAKEESPSRIWKEEQISIQERTNQIRGVVLNGRGSEMRRVPEGFCHLGSLQILKLSDFPLLSTLPDHFGELQNLRVLVLSGLPLTTLPDSFKQLKLLKSLDISNSPSFFFTPEMFHVLEFMTELLILRISHCPQLVVLPHLANQVSLRELDLRYTGLRELPNSISRLTKLETLLIGSDNLTNMPAGLEELSSLTSLAIYDCDLLGSLPEAVQRLSTLQSLKIEGTPVAELGLQTWHPSKCNLNSLKCLSLFNTRVCRISISTDCCPSLETLWLSCNSHLRVMETLPTRVKEIIVHGCEKMEGMRCIWWLADLTNLVVSDCPKLQVLPIPDYMHSLGRKITITGCPKAVKALISPLPRQKIGTFTFHAADGSIIESVTYDDGSITERVPEESRDLSGGEYLSDVGKRMLLNFEDNMGKTWSFRETGKMCAMKEVAMFFDDPKSKEILKQLVQAVLSQLRHPNIVEYYESEMAEFMANASQSRASTSSSKKPRYDVFINSYEVYGIYPLARIIYQVFDILGVKAFLDREELKRGDSILEAITEAIRSASVHIAIFSPSYAESPWCLDELLLMLQTNVPIIPVFYHVQPSDLRHVENGIYAYAFARHEGNGSYDLEDIQKWKDALGRASDISGAILKADKCDEGKLVTEIVCTSILKMHRCS